ncbi:hypothetical protein SDC9_193888 [bioreactor metagenome]|uniref:Uncharacterized protein n=1 Tax=bioreactor metagenome TaxID=1076179 RepID=A0A645I678_9ZZZZ
MKGEHVRACQQLLQRDISGQGQPLVAGQRVAGQDLQLQRRRDAPRGPADAPEAQKAHGFARQLGQGSVPIAKVGRGGPLAGLNRGVVGAYPMA